MYLICTFYLKYFNVSFLLSLINTHTLNNFFHYLIGGQPSLKGQSEPLKGKTASAVK